MKIKKILKRNFFIRKVAITLRDCISKTCWGGVTIINKGCSKIHKDVIGKNNTIVVNSGCVLDNTKIRIRGNNNIITFGERCYVGQKCSFWMEGDNITIEIGANTTFTHTVHFCAQESNTKIIIGEDCMFSNNIIVRTSDSHIIYDKNTNQRINQPKDVIIGKHVWIAPNSKVFKGVIIEDNSIIGSNSLVTKNIPSNTLAVGSPAKVVKQDIYWTREKLF